LNLLSLMKMFSGLILLLWCSVCSQASQFLKNGAAPVKAAPAKAAPAKGEAKGKDAASAGPAHSDNFQEELVDQADPEFDMISGGDGCMSWDDMHKVLTEQFQVGASDPAGMTEEMKKEETEMKEMIMKDEKMIFDHSDTNKDGCLDKAEFKGAGEMEGPPPGFQKKKQAKMGDEAFDNQMEDEEKFEFNSMDTSNDGKISKTESYHYVNENMPQADIDQTQMDTMFDDADTDEDGFLSFEEFSQAGEEIDGDGNEMEKVPPMVFFTILEGKKGVLISAAKKRLLAHKPPLKIMAILLGKDEPAKTKKEEPAK